MPNKSEKELADEIEGLSIIELASLAEALEEKFGAFRKSSDSFWVDDRVFIFAYEIIITAEYADSKERVQAVRKFQQTFSYSLNEAKAFFQELPITIPWPIVKDDALEIRKKYMDAGLTVKLKWRSGYITRNEYYQYNEHQRDQLSNTPPEPDL